MWIFRKRGGLLILILLVLGGPLILWLARPWLAKTVQEVQVWRSVRQAKMAAQNDGHATALRHLEEAYRKFPYNRTLLQEMADYLEWHRSAQAIALRQRLIGLHPDILTFRLDYTSTLLALNRTRAARDVLEDLPESPKQKARFQALWGSVHFQEENYEKAVRHFDRAARLEPANTTFRFNLLAARLNAGGEGAETALAELMELQQNARYRETAAAARVVHALQADRARETVEDALLILGRESDWYSPHYRTLLTAFQCWSPDRLTEEIIQLWSSPEESGLAAAEHLRWLESRGSREEVLAGYDALSPMEIQAPQVVLWEGEILVAEARETDLEACLEKEAWDSMRLLHLALRAWLSRENPAVSRLAAESLARQGSRDPQQLLFAAALLSRWGMQAEAEFCWEALALTRHPAWEMGWSVMKTGFRARADATAERHFYRKLAEAHPERGSILARHLYLELLTGADVETLLNPLQALVDRSGQRPEAVCLQAWALLRAGRPQEARRNLGSVSLEALDSPYARLAAARVLHSENPEQAEALLRPVQHQLTLPEQRTLISEMREVALSERN